MDPLRNRRIQHFANTAWLIQRKATLVGEQRRRADDLQDHMLEYAVLIAKPIDPNKTRGKVV